MDIDRVATLAETIRREVHKAVVGQDATLDLLLVGLLSDGHVLIEGVPGTAKTMIARCFAATLDLDFGRIQFTPDLMPGDVIGTNIFNFTDSRFVLTKGPVFTRTTSSLTTSSPLQRRPCGTASYSPRARKSKAWTRTGSSSRSST